APRFLHSFPTRRSSDLIRWAFSFEGGNEIVGCHHAHPEPRLMRRTRNVWSKDDVFHREQFRFDLRLSFEHIQPCARNFSLSHSAYKSLLIHDGSARGVDDDAGGFHERKRTVVEQVVSLRKQRHME